MTITRNKTRSLLTGFGVFWGILMLVILLGSGNGFKNGVLKNVDGFSTNSAFFFSERTGEPYKGYKKGRSVQRAYKQAKLAFHLKAFMRKDRLRRFKADRLGQAGVCGVPVGAAL